MPIYKYQCRVCDDIFSAFFSVDERYDAVHCDVKADKFIPDRIYTDVDRAYKFIADIFKGGPVQIRSKGHYKDLLKLNNMPDCSPVEGCQEARLKKKDWGIRDSTRIKKTADKLIRKMQHDNVNHDAKAAIKKLIKGSRKEG